MRRWIWKAMAGAAGAGALTALYAWAGERTRVQLDHFTVPVDKPGLPAEGITILHLSDLHCRAHSRIQARKLARLKRLLAGEQYDILALTGDLIHDAPGFPAALSFIQGLRPRLGAFSVPGNHDYCESSVWGILGPVTDGKGPASLLKPATLLELGARVGDFAQRLARNEQVHQPLEYHDVPAMNAALAREGIHPLMNRSFHLAAGGVDLWLAGIDDEWEGHPDLPQAVSGVPEGAPLLLLAHNPDVMLDPCVERADLVLSGHVHGGQLRLPFVGAISTQGTHLTRQRPDGWFRRGDTRMFVSRGVGESLPLRFRALPQAALIRLIPAQEAPARS